MRLKRRVRGVRSCTGGEAGRSLVSSAAHEMRGTSLDAARRRSSSAAAWSSGSCSALLFVLVPRLKRPAGSKVLRRRRSFSLFPGRSRVGIALALAAHLRTSRGDGRTAVHGRLGVKRGEGQDGGSRRKAEAGVPGAAGRQMAGRQCGHDGKSVQRWCVNAKKLNLGR
jgi:hypothetical protein